MEKYINGCLEEQGVRNYKVRGNFQGGDVHYLDCVDSFMDMYICQNLSSCTLLIYSVYCMSVKLNEVLEKRKIQWKKEEI